jgi:serine/threonine-protein kinase
MQGSIPPARLSMHMGELLDGRYRVMDVIGRGGHGVVYKGWDEDAQRDVAIKFLHPEIAADPEYNVRLLREAQACAKLAGTAAIQIFALRTDPSTGALFEVMELLEGRDLEEHLEAWESQGKFVPLEHLTAIFDPIVYTLEQAHSMGIVHRDLKPQNVYLTKSQQVKLLDFGLAKMMKASPLTREGMVAGSPSYIAPEVWRGDPRKLDHRIDVYSLGALMFRVLGGQPPFKGSLIELMQAALGAERPSLHALRKELPPDIDEWVKQALAIQPDHRFQKVTGMWTALRSILKL